ncbi:uncharacterized protein [Parasteatoda tepidariorum]|uniref:uncharacterized protein n=1 Tax=Parasteatoda tepidariorum TaxID=114398 RepID=UPI00077F88CC|nr:uncharacterized protein LOC107440199 [Parasteatoda tepidariorum]
MSHQVSQSAILILVLCVMAEAFDFGKYQPLIPSNEEKELCKKHANGRNLEKTYKKFWKTCYVYCLYENGITPEVLLTPKGTLCCDFVGIGPSGVCNNGECVPFWRS